MKKNIKRFLLCLLAVSTLSISGNVYADTEEDAAAEVSDETAEETGEEAAEGEQKQEKVKLKETEEKIKAESADIVKYLEKIGNVDGFDIYRKDKDIDDKIWEANGGKPEKKKDYTEAQEALDDTISELKKLGDLVAVDEKTGEAVASFEDSNKCDSGLLYVSEAKRFLLYIDEELTKPSQMLQVISSIDDPYVFRNSEGDELTLMDEKYKKVIRTYRDGGSYYGDYEMFFGDDDNFIWLSKDRTQVLGTFRYGTDNGTYRMIIDDRRAIIGLENKETQYIWWSSPIGATRDKVATPLLINELRSSNILRYGIPSKRSNNNVVRSNTDDCEVKVSDITNGIRVEYKYASAGFTYPVEYTLEKDHLKASLKVSEIKEEKSENIATEMTIMGAFGAAPSDEDGYFVIPDGSGALVRFNNQKTMDTNAYTQRVYGSDVTVVPTSKGAVTEQIYMPVYGIVREDNAMLVVASKGDSNAYLTTQVSKQSNSSYNLCRFTFILRGTDTFYMSGNNSDKLTVFESGDIKSDDIELLYYPISKEGADYVDVAQKYRDYLTTEGGVKIKATSEDSQMYLDLYGGTLKKKPVLGVPVTMKQSITSYDEASNILNLLKNDGVEDMLISYSGWTNDGICSKVDTEAKPSGKLGGKSDFNALTSLISDNGWKLYPATDNRTFYSGNGYYSFTSTTVRVSGAYSRIVSYDRAYGIPDGFKKNMSQLSPSYFGEVIGGIADSYSAAGLSGANIGDLTTALYGDYGKKNISRYTAMGMLTDSYEQLSSDMDDGILADGANAYAFSYVDHIKGVPLSSSRFDLFNEDIPFYQIVMHGIIPYSTTAVNADADSETLLLMAAATGSSLCYDMIYEETSLLKDTSYDKYYYANYSNWVETAAAEYKLMKPLLDKVSGAVITGYETENEGNRITTTYSNGTVVKVDLEEKTIDYNGNHIVLADYEAEGGIRF